MKRGMLLLAIGALLTAGMSSVSAAEIAGSTLVDASDIALRQIVTGWSVKKKVLGKPIYNEKNEKVGKVDDIIIAADRSVSYAIIDAGGFLGVRHHDVAISVDYIRLIDGKFVITGATRDTLNKMPVFKYTDTP